MLTLDVAIATHRREGIERVAKMIPSEIEGVRYVVSWQEYDGAEVPELLVRNDVEIHKLDKKGLSANRNNALKHCRGDIVLIADDDLIYYNDFPASVLIPFERNENLDLATFKLDYFIPKIYPERDCELALPLPKNYYVSSVEIAYRRRKLNGLNFWENIGLGNEFLGCGEDELFLLSALRRGLKCNFFNKTIAAHPSETSGNKKNADVLRAQGFIIALQYPISCLLRIPLKAFRVSNGKWKFLFKNLWHLSRGAVYSLNYKKKVPENCRWP